MAKGKGKYSLEFGGAAREVGRSSFVLDIGDKFLLDHGVKLNSEENEFPLKIKTNLNGMFLSHAHFDHSGNIPHLFTYMNPVLYMTAPTLDIARVLWYDTIKIADMEKEQFKFSSAEIDVATNATFVMNYKKPLQVTDNTVVDFFQAGHIPGAAMTKFYFDNKSLLYTGDFKLSENHLYYGADLKSPKNCDYLIIETTYGDREHTPREETEKLLAEKAQETIDRGGHVLLPSFAISRGQEVIDILVRNNFSAPIYYDGMGQKIARIFLDYPKFLKDAKLLKKSLEKSIWIKKRNMRKKVFDEPCAIVTSAGMLQGGPVMFYLPHIVKNKHSSILFPGYQIKGTPGRYLIDNKKLLYEGKLLDVKCYYEKFDLSGHPPQSELLKTIEKLNPEKVFCVHGDTKVIDIFLKELKFHGFEGIAPKVGDKVFFD